MAGRSPNEALYTAETQFPRFGTSSSRRKFAITNQTSEEFQLLEILQNYSTEKMENFVDLVINERGEESFQSNDLFGLIVGASSKNRACLTDCLGHLIEIINKEKTDISGENAELIESIGNMIKRLILECEKRRFFNGPQINILLKSFIASISDLKDRYPVFLEIENACIERDIYSERFEITNLNDKRFFTELLAFQSIDRDFSRIEKLFAKFQTNTSTFLEGNLKNTLLLFCQKPESKQIVMNFLAKRIKREQNNDQNTAMMFYLFEKTYNPESPEDLNLFEFIKSHSSEDLRARMEIIIDDKAKPLVNLSLEGVGLFIASNKSKRPESFIKEFDEERRKHAKVSKSQEDCFTALCILTLLKNLSEENQSKLEKIIPTLLKNLEDISTKDPNLISISDRFVLSIYNTLSYIIQTDERLAFLKKYIKEINQYDRVFTDISLYLNHVDTKHLDWEIKKNFPLDKRLSPIDQEKISSYTAQEEDYSDAELTNILSGREFYVLKMAYGQNYLNHEEALYPLSKRPSSLSRVEDFKKTEQIILSALSHENPWQIIDYFIKRNIVRVNDCMAILLKLYTAQKTEKDLKESFPILAKHPVEQLTKLSQATLLVEKSIANLMEKISPLQDEYLNFIANYILDLHSKTDQETSAEEPFLTYLKHKYPRYYAKTQTSPNHPLQAIYFTNPFAYNDYITGGLKEKSHHDIKRIERQETQKDLEEIRKISNEARKGIATNSSSTARDAHKAEETGNPSKLGFLQRIKQKFKITFGSKKPTAAQNKESEAAIAGAPLTDRPKKLTIGQRLKILLGFKKPTVAQNKASEAQDVLLPYQEKTNTANEAQDALPPQPQPVTTSKKPANKSEQSSVAEQIAKLLRTAPKVPSHEPENTRAKQVKTKSNQPVKQ